MWPVLTIPSAFSGAVSWPPASSSLPSSSAIPSRPLLNQHFLEQHVLDLDRRHRVDAREQLLAQAVDAARPAQILDPKLAQEDLAIVDDARQHRLDLRRVLLLLDLQADGELQEVRLAAAGVEIDEKVGQVEEGERLRRRRLFRGLLAHEAADRAVVIEIPARPPSRSTSTSAPSRMIFLRSSF